MSKHSNGTLSAGRSNREQARHVGDVERILSVGAGTLFALTGFSALGRSPLKGLLGMGLGAGVNVLIGGSGRSFALQPVSLEGSVAVNVTVGLSGLQLRAVY